MGVADSIYQLFFKRSTVYVPFVLVGAFFADEAMDGAIASVWESHNQGKLFKHLSIPPAEE